MTLSREPGPDRKPEPRHTHKASALAALCCLAVAACGEDAAPAPRGLLGSDGRPRVVAPQAAPSAAEPVEAEAAPEDFGTLPDTVEQEHTSAAVEPSMAAGSQPSINGAQAPAARGTAPGQPATGAPTPANAGGRDLAQELLALLPPPVTCVDFAKAVETGGQLTIEVEAMVMPSGALSRASVSVPGQPAAGTCLQQRVLGGQLAPDVPNAPVNVRASLPLEIVGQKPAATTASPAAAPSQPAPDVATADGTEYARPSD